MTIFTVYTVSAVQYHRFHFSRRSSGAVEYFCLFAYTFLVIIQNNFCVIIEANGFLHCYYLKEQSMIKIGSIYLEEESDSAVLFLSFNTKQKIFFWWEFIRTYFVFLCWERQNSKPNSRKTLTGATRIFPCDFFYVHQ